MSEKEKMNTQNKKEISGFLKGVEIIGNKLKCTLFTGHPVRRVHFALYD